uniref:Uncharacterized protein n=1 Tax=Steinernema glaseri TaxID=37863 RepID=A0A1I7ZG12_9BILA
MLFQHYSWYPWFSNDQKSRDASWTRFEANRGATGSQGCYFSSAVFFVHSSAFRPRHNLPSLAPHCHRDEGAHHLRPPSRLLLGGAGDVRRIVRAPSQET